MSACALHGVATAAQKRVSKKRSRDCLIPDLYRYKLFGNANESRAIAHFSVANND